MGKSEYVVMLLLGIAIGFILARYLKVELIQPSSITRQTINNSEGVLIQ